MNRNILNYVNKDITSYRYRVQQFQFFTKYILFTSYSFNYVIYLIKSTEHMVKTKDIYKMFFFNQVDILLAQILTVSNRLITDLNNKAILIYYPQQYSLPSLERIIEFLEQQIGKSFFIRSIVNTLQSIELNKSISNTPLDEEIF